ncbi:MAG: IclR family transcriptional regulator [Allobranchiibius sp.]
MTSDDAIPETRESRAMGGVQSVDRAVTVLEILARRGSGGVSEIADEIGVHKSTAFRLLAALEEHELVRQAEERGHYELGFGILRLANAIPSRLDLVRQARPVMDALARELDETINIAVLRQGFVVNVGQSIGRSAIAAHNWIGELTPPHATSSGKVLLAALTPSERRKITKQLHRFTERTITTRAALEEDLRAVKRDGYSSSSEELEIGLHAVAAPIRDHTGNVVAALSVSGPSYRFSEDRTAEVLAAVRRGTDSVNTRLGNFSVAPGA